MKHSPRKEYTGIQRLSLANYNANDGNKVAIRIRAPHSVEKEKPTNMILKRMTFVILSVALPLLLLSIILGWVVIPCLIRFQISSKVVISPNVNPDLYKAWVHPPVPVYLKIYLFNVTNPEQVRRGALPKLQELGPYVFLENRTKVDIRSGDDDDSISYKERIAYHFQMDLSGGASLQDEVTVINVPYVAAAIKISQDLSWPIDDFALSILTASREKLFVKRTVDEALFTGWKVPFLEKIEKDMGLSLIPNNTFGFFVGQNDTAQGPYMVSRGKSDKSKFGAILKFKNQSELNFWTESSSCNKIKGTDGTIFPPFVDKNTVLTLFNAELCRSLDLTYEQDTAFEGIKGFRFTAPASVLTDPRESDENRCYCVDIEKYPESCLKQGALDLGPCREGAPVAMSTPYFLDGDREYIEKSGLEPSRGKHETFMIIEPITGVIMDASKKIQINLMLKPVKKISSLSRVPDMLFPLVWADECASLDPASTQQFKSVLSILWVVDFISKWVLLGIMLTISLAIIITKTRVCSDGGEQRKFTEVSQVADEGKEADNGRA